MGSDLDMLLDVLRAIAREGLHYSQDSYDRARYDKLLRLASEQYTHLTGLNTHEIREIFLRDHGSITPKVGVEAAITDEDGRILVLRRPDRTWCLPGGWAEVGESPGETARREAREETGLEITPIGYIAIGHRTPLTYPDMVSQVNICVATRPLARVDTIALSHEHSAYRWIAGVDDITDWHPGHARFIPHIIEAYRQQRFFPLIED